MLLGPGDTLSAVLASTPAASPGVAPGSPRGCPSSSYPLLGPTDARAGPDLRLPPPPRPTPFSELESVWPDRSAQGDRAAAPRPANSASEKRHLGREIDSRYPGPSMAFWAVGTLEDASKRPAPTAPYLPAIRWRRRSSTSFCPSRMAICRLLSSRLRIDLQEQRQGVANQSLQGGVNPRRASASASGSSPVGYLSTRDRVAHGSMNRSPWRRARPMR
jgi:hypothetical protein